MTNSKPTENKKRQPRVVVYSTPTCPHCRTAKSYLKSKGISYTDVNVARDASAARDMVRLTGQQGVPVIHISGKRPIIGFDRAAIDRFLDL